MNNKQFTKTDLIIWTISGIMFPLILLGAYYAFIVNQ